MHICKLKSPTRKTVNIPGPLRVNVTSNYIFFNCHEFIQFAVNENEASSSKVGHALLVVY